jgi:hypothetical protein
MQAVCKLPGVVGGNEKVSVSVAVAFCDTLKPTPLEGCAEFVGLFGEV